MPRDVLTGRDRVRITYDLHGLQALSNDASAVIFDQGENDSCVNQPGCRWHYVSLSDYGQNGDTVSQTVDLPLTAFGGLEPTQPINGIVHTRFWCQCQFRVDITSIVVYKS